MKKVHIRLEYSEAIDGKKGILASELEVLKILKKIRIYKNMRKREMILKTKLRTKIKQLIAELSSIETYFPEEETEGLNLPKIKRKKTSSITNKEKGYSSDIENQLREIEEKLAALS